MSRSALIVGAGPAAAAAALALAEEPDIAITVIDVGGQLEAANESARQRLGSQVQSAWSPDDLRVVTRQPVDQEVKGLPEKRTYGSDFPFRNLGQLDLLSVGRAVNGSVISSAFGGFSNVWGAQVMPFSDPTFQDWPIAPEVMRAHYAAVLRHIPYAAEEDDLARLFPLIGSGTRLPPLSGRSTAVLTRYENHRSRVRPHGVTLGRARLAMNSRECVRCALCLTGCPYELIYSASQTLRSLESTGRIKYLAGLLAVRLDEPEGVPTVFARDLQTETLQSFSADRVFVACGAIGSSRLAMGSLGLYGRRATVSESSQFVVPFLSRRATSSPIGEPTFTLNQFNMLVDLSGAGYSLAHLHFYTYSAAFLNALPGLLGRARLSLVRDHLLRRLSVALGYAPSWLSPTFALQVGAAPDEASLPTLRLDAQRVTSPTLQFVGAVMRRIVTVAPYLDLWPVLPQFRMSARGKSYHWGSTFPHAERSNDTFSSDVLGRVGPWKRIHLIDASVLPTIASTTFTLTVMANAHRIVTTSMGGGR